MSEATWWVGLDVHASRTAVAVDDTPTRAVTPDYVVEPWGGGGPPPPPGEVTKRTVLGRPHEVMEVLEALPGRVRAVYEAGPTGYGLARRSRRGLEISVCAPGEIAGGGGAKSRIKTDARDALKLARLHMAGELTLVVVPSVEQEQVRDLVRAREDVRADLMRARHRLGKFCCAASATSPAVTAPGRPCTVTGWPRSSLTTCRPRRRSPTICTRTTPSSRAATAWTSTSSRPP